MGVHLLIPDKIAVACVGNLFILMHLYIPVRGVLRIDVAGTDGISAAVCLLLLQGLCLIHLVIKSGTTGIKTAKIVDKPTTHGSCG